MKESIIFRFTFAIIAACALSFTATPAVGGTGTASATATFLMLELPKGHHTIHYNGTYHFAPPSSVVKGLISRMKRSSK